MFDRNGKVKWEAVFPSNSVVKWNSSCRGPMIQNDTDTDDLDDDFDDDPSKDDRQ